MEINLAELKKLMPDINEFAKQIIEVQLMPDNIVYDLIKALDGRTVTIKGIKES